MVYFPHARARALIFVAVLAASALTMIWAFWHHPVKTAILTLAVLAGFGVLARVARLIETDAAHSDQRNHGI